RAAVGTFGPGAGVLFAGLQLASTTTGHGDRHRTALLERRVTPAPDERAIDAACCECECNASCGSFRGRALQTWSGDARLFRPADFPTWCSMTEKAEWSLHDAWLHGGTEGTVEFFAAAFEARREVVSRKTRQSPV